MVRTTFERRTTLWNILGFPSPLISMETEEWSWHAGLGLGLKDSIVGIGSLWRVPKEAVPREDKSDEKEKPLSTLERRRQQKKQETQKETLAVKRQVCFHFPWKHGHHLAYQISKWPFTFYYLHLFQEGRSVVIHRVLQCMLLNGGVVLLSIIIFNYVLTPILQFVISFIYDQTSSSKFVS